MNHPLTAEEAKQYSEHSLFADKSWRWSPNPWPLSPDICRWIEGLGEAAMAFFESVSNNTTLTSLHLENNDIPVKLLGKTNFLTEVKQLIFDK